MVGVRGNQDGSWRRRLRADPDQGAAEVAVERGRGCTWRMVAVWHGDYRIDPTVHLHKNGRYLHQNGHERLGATWVLHHRPRAATRSI